MLRWSIAFQLIRPLSFAQAGEILTRVGQIASVTLGQMHAKSEATSPLDGAFVEGARNPSGDHYVAKLNPQSRKLGTLCLRQRFASRFCSGQPFRQAIEALDFLYRGTSSRFGNASFQLHDLIGIEDGLFQLGMEIGKSRFGRVETDGSVKARIVRDHSHVHQGRPAGKPGGHFFNRA